MGQTLQMFTAGFETISGTISFSLYEFCKNRQIQDKLREEIQSCIKAHNGLTYECINEMKYLNMCVQGKIVIKHLFSILC